MIESACSERMEWTKKLCARIFFYFFQDCTHIVSVHLSSHSLPKVVKRRVNALKNLQVKCAHIEAKFYEEVHELERKYAALYQPLFDKVRHC